MQELGITPMDAEIAWAKLPPDHQRHVRTQASLLVANTNMNPDDALAVVAAVGAWLAEHETD